MQFAATYINLKPSLLIFNSDMMVDDRSVSVAGPTPDKPRPGCAAAVLCVVACCEVRAVN